MNNPIYQTKEIRALEQLAMDRFGIAPEVLMQRAGKAAFDYLLRRWPHAKSILVACGGGNNGGDGYILARLLHERGLDVRILKVGELASTETVAGKAFAACQQLNIPLFTASYQVDFQQADLIVDAICGIGLKDNLRSEITAIVDAIAAGAVPVLALDIPTGIHADTGQVLGKAISATATITFIGLKLGLLMGSGLSYTGELVCNDLHLPHEIFSLVAPVAEKGQIKTYAHHLKPRPRDWHKGLAGHVLVVGGDYGFSGAARMAAEGALRVGAGLVSIATRPEHAYALNANRPELMCHAVLRAKTLLELTQRADVIVVGPGLGRTAWSRMLWTTLQKTKQPLIVDGDGLNLLAEKPWHSERWILTPHLGEAARLLKMAIAEIQQDKLGALHALQKKYGGVCVLKGAGTLVGAANVLPMLCDKGNPGMASGGMGDVLGGVIAGLLAQGIPAKDAARLGVCLHAVAGDDAAKEGERGTLAMDLMPHLRRRCNLDSTTDV